MWEAPVILENGSLAKNSQSREARPAAQCDSAATPRTGCSSLVESCSMVRTSCVAALARTAVDPLRSDAWQTGGGQALKMPRADEIPSLAVEHHSVPCTNNPLGVKGAGESGVAGALPSAFSAVIDALSTRGVKDFDLPATPSRVWAALHTKTPA